MDERPSDACHNLNVDFDREQHPHRRYNPLLDEYVLVSPHRTQRPWLGQEEQPAHESRPDFDPSCYLCPGNGRAGGAMNPMYEDTYVFRNDFSALLPDSPGSAPSRKMFGEDAVSGQCRVICFSAAHNLTLATMSPHQIEGVIDLWCQQCSELEQKYKWVQVFENHGPAMGASNPHPHGQIWASDYVPTLPTREHECQARYMVENGEPLLLAYLREELVRKERLVIENDHWAWLVPHWAVWPFEVILLPKRHVMKLPDLTDAERSDLARILKAGLMGFDRLFGVDFPYSMGWHGAPSDGGAHWQLHAHFYPPLLRSATVRKFMVGYEMLAEAQRDITPEQAAARLREVTPGGH